MVQCTRFHISLFSLFAAASALPGKKQEADQKNLNPVIDIHRNKTLELTHAVKFKTTFRVQRLKKQHSSVSHTQGNDAIHT